MALRESPGLQRWGKPLLVLLLLLYGVVLLRTAWLSDDAYITFRTVDNLLHGRGLTWNPGERVQAYTHPLWLLALTVTTAILRSPYYAALLLGMLLSLTAVVVFARRAGSTRGALLGVAILTLSRGFVDYSTSGLENPLTHLLLVLFCVAARDAAGSRGVFVVSLMACLLMVNRMDAILLVAPVLGWLLWRERSWKSVRAAALGFVPFIAWELFSLLYYGFLFPNTAYAKLATGIPRGALIRQGLGYLASEARFDLVTLLAIAVGVALAWSRGGRLDRLLTCGIALHLGYVVTIGGDFMSGRFLTAPLLLAVIVTAENARRIGRWVMLPTAAVLIAVGLFWSHPTVSSGSRYGHDGVRIDGRGVADERAVYYRYTGLLRSGATTGRSRIDMPWARQGRSLSGGGGGMKQDDPRRQSAPIYVTGNIGLLGYYAGPGTHIVDQCGLADPLLARLPTMDLESWRVGHFDRAIPEGYVQSILSGQNQIRDEGLAAFYTELKRITRGRLFTRRRWAAIWKMNLGRYDHLLRE